MNRKQTDLPVYLFHQGTNYRAYELLGCHREPAEPGHFRYVFRVWAPNADAVSVVSDMTSWDSSDGEPMRKISDGVWEAFVERDYDCEGKFYKFAVRRNGKTCYKSDPYAFCCEKPGRTASVVYTRLPEFADDSWLRQRHLELFHLCHWRIAGFLPLRSGGRAPQAILSARTESMEKDAPKGHGPFGIPTNLECLLLWFSTSSSASPRP